MAEQDFLIAQQKVFDDLGADHGLGRFQGVGVLQRVLLERHRGQLLGKAFPRVSRRNEIQRALEDVLVDGGRPVVVGQEPAGLPDQQHEVREEVPRVNAPLRYPLRVDARRQLIELLDDLRLVPRTEQPAAQHLVHGLDHGHVRGRRLTAPGRDHPVRAGQLVVQRLEAVLHDLGGFFLGVLPLVQHRRVVELGERVDEQLPVAADLGPVGVVLGHLAERVALDALGQWSQVVGQRLGVLVEVDEDEPFPHLAADRRPGRTGSCRRRRTRPPAG